MNKQKQMILRQTIPPQFTEIKNVTTKILFLLKNRVLIFVFSF